MTAEVQAGAWDRRLQAREDPAALQFRQDLEAGRDWFDALLDAIAVWRTPGERHAGRTYQYLIGGEAFDWMLLAERLVGGVNGLVPHEQSEELLFHGRPPWPVTPEEFGRRIGPAKLHSATNFWYGVLVEEALQLAVEHEVRKSRRGGLRPEESLLDDMIYERIYGKTRQQLLAEYFAERKELAPEAMSLADLREFTYWLFKYRVRASEPARMASDTKKGIEWLRRMRKGALDACA
jgi:hypothetical protein